jgi:hypothetical protein
VKQKLRWSFQRVVAKRTLSNKRRKAIDSVRFVRAIRATLRVFGRSRNADAQQRPLSLSAVRGGVTSLSRHEAVAFYRKVRSTIVECDGSHAGTPYSDSP